MLAAAADPKLGGQLLGARLVGHGVMADVVVAAQPSAMPAARQVARLLRAPMATPDDWDRARVVIVDETMVSSTAIREVVMAAARRGASWIVVAAVLATQEAIEAVLPFVDSVHALGLR